MNITHERDPLTTLDYRGARYYDSDIGRFLSADPLAADFASWSPYNYVMGNPISLIDPDGRGVDWFVNSLTGDVLHIPEKVDLKSLNNTSPDMSSYRKFASDSEMENGSSNGKVPSSASYDYKKYSATSITDNFREWGVNFEFSLATIQDYSFDNFITEDYEIGGKIETSVTLNFEVKNTEFRIIKTFDKENILFNKVNNPKLVDIKFGFMYRVETFEGRYLSVSNNGSISDTPFSGFSTKSNGSENIIIDLSKDLIENLIK